MKNWKDLSEQYYDHAGQCYVFFRGVYFRPRGGQHMCPDCFFRPVREREQREKQEREKARLEELQRLEEQRRKADEEKRRREEQERLRREKEEAARIAREAEERRQREENEKQLRCEANMKNLQESIHIALEREYDKQTNKCYELKMPTAAGDDDEANEALALVGGDSDQNYSDQQIQQQWNTLNLFNLIDDINPNKSLSHTAADEIDEEEAVTCEDIQPEKNSASTTSEIFQSAVIVCRLLETKYGYKVSVEQNIHSNTHFSIYDVVGQLLSVAKNEENLSIIKSLERVAVKEKPQQATGSRLETEASMSNPICQFTEDLLLDSIEHAEPWAMRVCINFFSQVAPFVVSHGKQGEVEWMMNYPLSALGWTPKDIYNIIKSAMLAFSAERDELCNCLQLILRHALRPSDMCKHSTHTLQSVFESRDKTQLNDIETQLEDNKQEKSLKEVLTELTSNKIPQSELVFIETIIEKHFEIINQLNGKYEEGMRKLIDVVKSKQWDDEIAKYSNMLALTAMTAYTCKTYWPSNTQLVSYCLLVAREPDASGRLLQIATGEGKSCIIAMTAATYALLGQTVDVVTSSTVLSQRDAEELQAFYQRIGLSASCNVADVSEEDADFYDHPIVYGTVGTFARDILKTEFQLKDIRHGRPYDVVIVDEVDSMLIDQGVQCTYLSHNVASSGMRHTEPVLALIWMTLSGFAATVDVYGNVLYRSAQEAFFVTLSRLCDDSELIHDPIQLLQIAENEKIVQDGFTTEYKNLENDVKKASDMLTDITDELIAKFFRVAEQYVPVKVQTCQLNSSGEREVVNLDENGKLIPSELDEERIPILLLGNGLTAVLMPEDILKAQISEALKSAIPRANEKASETQMEIPCHLRDYCSKRLSQWIDNAFLARRMRVGREYVIGTNEIWPVDYASTGITELNKKWGDGLQQFLEMKHRLALSPLSVVTNYLSNVEFFCRYGRNVLGVSGTLGTESEKGFMTKTYSVQFLTYRPLRGKNYSNVTD